MSAKMFFGKEIAIDAATIEHARHVTTTGIGGKLRETVTLTLADKSTINVSKPTGEEIIAYLTK